MARERAERYSTVSIILHWTIVVLLLAQVWIGGWFDDLPRGPAKGEAFRLHASMGVTILLLSLARLGWRLAHPWPELPGDMPRWEKMFARATHAGFYLVMIGMPLTGWLAVSAGGGDPIPIWGVLPWPRAPGVPDAAQSLFEFLHVTIILKLFWVLLALHVAGALKNHFVARNNVLARMLPPIPRPRPRQP